MRYAPWKQSVLTVVLVLLNVAATAPGYAEDNAAKVPQMLRGTTTKDARWEVLPLHTVGQEVISAVAATGKKQAYRPPGVMDGIAAFRMADDILRVLVNHELQSIMGYPYRLENGTRLTGARVSFLDIDMASLQVRDAGLAYRRIIDRAGKEVTDPVQINEGYGRGGFAALCSSQGIVAATSAFVDDLYFTGEEVAEFGELQKKGFGGQEVALDVHNQTAYVVPMLGRAAFENVAEVDTGTPDRVALVIGDDRQAGPLYLYIGQKDARPGKPYRPPDFLVRNGLGMGQLYVWVAADGERTPDQFHGTGAARAGHFRRIRHFEPAFAGMSNHDALGFASLALQDIRADAAGAFMFSRPEDVAVNPANGRQFVLASTGRGAVFAGDVWGTIYRVDIDFGNRFTEQGDVIENIPATVTILYDGDDAGNRQFPAPDFGLRSPDNLDWAGDGYLYIQEDSATMPAHLFGRESKREASVWRLQPETGKLIRILEMDRTAVPSGKRDVLAHVPGAWESSGILDVSAHFNRDNVGTATTMLLLTVQAHGLVDAVLSDRGLQAHDLVEGGQLLLVIRRRK